MGVGVHHGLTFNFDSAKVCSPAIFEICSSFDKDTWIAATDYLHNCAISIESYSPINKCYSFIIFSLRNTAAILLLNCLALKLYLYIHFLSLKHNYVILLLNCLGLILYLYIHFLFLRHCFLY